MNNQCNYYFNLWFRIVNRLGYYNGILNSPCSSECSIAISKAYIGTLQIQLEKVEKILEELKCPGFVTVTLGGK